MEIWKKIPAVISLRFFLLHYNIFILFPVEGYGKTKTLHRYEWDLEGVFIPRLPLIVRFDYNHYGSICKLTVGISTINTWLLQLT